MLMAREVHCRDHCSASEYVPSPAPWAETVPGHGPVAVDILLDLPDDGFIYEVVEGVLVRMAGRRVLCVRTDYSSPAAAATASIVAGMLFSSPAMAIA